MKKFSIIVNLRIRFFKHLPGGTTNIYLPSGEMVEDLGMVELHVEINRLKSELREKSQQVQDVERLAK